MEKSVFDLWVYTDWPSDEGGDYTEYKLYIWKEGTASSLEEAEKMIMSYLDLFPKNEVQSFLIREVPLNRRCPGKASLTSYLYDRNGVRIDQRTFSTIPEDDSVFPGRTPDQIRFREGDIVEFIDDNRISLGVVTAVPPGVGKASRINNNQQGFHLDDTDDQYTVIFDSVPTHHHHVDALELFKPRYCIVSSEKRRLEKAYHDYVTMPVRLEILNTTARAQLTDFFERYGVKGSVQGINRLDEMFGITIELPDGPKELFVGSKKVFGHMDRVCRTLAHLAGIKVEGRGYRVRKSESGDLYF